MKFIYFGYDFMLGCVRRLIDEGHELAAIFTFECDNVFNFNVETLRLGQSLNIPVSQDKPTQADIESQIQNETTCFFSAGYPYKIPPIDEDKAYGINLHPSLLPKGRGLMPTPTIIMHEPNVAGLTAHKIVPTIDAGDILDQIPIPVGAHETVETYSARIAMVAPEMVSRIFKDIKEYWALAKPQDEAAASTFPIPDDQMRLIDWNEDIHTIDRKARAFGRFGCLAKINEKIWVIYDHDIWEEKHNHPPGTQVLTHPRGQTIAAKNGFFCIKEAHCLDNISI